MFIDVEQQIKTALENAFIDYPEIKDNIHLAIGKENILRETPVKMPAIRIVFMEATTSEENDLGATDFITELEYAVLLFFRSFKDKNAGNIYKYLQVIQETLKGYRTAKGVLKPAKTRLEITNNFYVYACNFKLETVI